LKASGNNLTPPGAAELQPRLEISPAKTPRRKEKVSLYFSELGVLAPLREIFFSASGLFSRQDAKAQRKGILLFFRTWRA
jgi:hypothetical protein